MLWWEWSITSVTMCCQEMIFELFWGDMCFLNLFFWKLQSQLRSTCLKFTTRKMKWDIPKIKWVNFCTYPKYASYNRKNEPNKLEEVYMNALIIFTYIVGKKMNIEFYWYRSPLSWCLYLTYLTFPDTIFCHSHGYNWEKSCTSYIDIWFY